MNPSLKILNIIEKLYQDVSNLGIAANKSLRGLPYHGIEKFFSIIMTTAIFIPKPYRAMAMHALKTLNVKNLDGFMIGDTVCSIKMGKNAKMNTIGVTWGYNTKEELNRAHADHIVNDPSALVKILKEL